MSVKRLLTGDRPTGKLHLGHYIGSLHNRIALQDQYECYFIIADIHTLTTHPEKEHITNLSVNIYNLVLDYLAVGIDPDKSTIFIQSRIAETFELYTLLGMLVNVPRLERIPTLKEMANAANLKSMPLGLLGYPVLQAADILLPRAHLVPVGKDNQAHVELTRELARRFNHLYGDVFPIPDLLLGEERTLVGTDGQSKMSKSLDNAIYLSDDEETVKRKVMGMYTDPKRIRADIPGRIEGNPVFIYHDIFNPNTEEIDDLKTRYQQGKVGDVEVKRKLNKALNEFLDPFRKRRAQYIGDPKLVKRILDQGTDRMRTKSQETIKLVRETMGVSNYFHGVELASKNPNKSSVLPIQGLAFV